MRTWVLLANTSLAASFTHQLISAKRGVEKLQNVLLESHLPSRQKRSGSTCADGMGKGLSGSSRRDGSKWPWILCAGDQRVLPNLQCEGIKTPWLQQGLSVELRILLFYFYYYFPAHINRGIIAKSLRRSRMGSQMTVRCFLQRFF